MTDQTQTETIALFRDLDDDALLLWAIDFRDAEFECTVRGDKSATINRPGDFPLMIVERQYGYGFNRLYNDGCATVELSHKKRDRHLRGIWTERGGGPRVPADVTRANDLAHATIAKEFAALVGKPNMVRPRPIYDLCKSKVRTTFANFGAPDGKGWLWNDTAIMAYIDRNDIMALARSQLADEANLAKSVASDVDASLAALMGETSADES
jgi:hypothetical protein